MANFASLNMLNHYPMQNVQVNNLLTCVLYWRQRKLLIRQSKNSNSLCIPSLQNKQWLLDCLKYAPIEAVLISPVFGQKELQIWAEACQQVGKPMFLRTTSNSQLRQHQFKMSWRLKRSLDWVAAATLVIILSPLILGLLIFTQLKSPGSILDSTWYIGNKGKLIRVFQFSMDTTNYRICQFNLNDLLRLFNVLRGEMSIVGSYPLRLNDVAHLDSNQQWQLKALPGITGGWKVGRKADLVDVQTMSQYNADYILNWSFQRDCEILLNSISKIFCNEQD
jgi:lipopolysaccharide/colanic/teichoic acid biosynthesis glycosyltransferase